MQKSNVHDDPTTPSRKAAGPRAPCGAGVSWLGVGVAFLAVAIFGHQSAFMGVGWAFLGLGIVFLADARRRR